MNDKGDTANNRNAGSGDTPTSPPLTPDNSAVLSGAKTDKPPEPETETAELVRETRLIEVLQFGSNAVLAVIGIIAICIYGGQLAAMKGQLAEIIRQYPELKKSADAAKSAADIAKETLQNAREQFRQDERPYVALAIAGERGKLERVVSGEHADHLLFELHFENFGKSPAINLAQDARIAIGVKEGKEIIFHKATDRQPRIISPGEKPSVYAYSDHTISEQEYADLLAGKVLAIAYGHVEYTDILGEPRPIYQSEFCTGLIFSKDWERESGQDCKEHTYMK